MTPQHDDLFGDERAHDLAHWVARAPNVSVRRQAAALLLLELALGDLDGAIDGASDDVVDALAPVRMPLR